MKRLNANEKFDIIQNYYASGVSIQENIFVPVLNDVVTEISKPRKHDLISNNE